MTMTTKERKQLKHSLKTDIDKAEMWILLAISGNKLEASKEDSTAQTRNTIIAELKQARKKICDNTNEYLAVIDELIEKMS